MYIIGRKLLLSSLSQTKALDAALGRFPVLSVLGGSLPGQEKTRQHIHCREWLSFCLHRDGSFLIRAFFTLSVHFLK